MAVIKELIEKYVEAFPEGNVKQDEPMKNHTSFRIGGKVRGLFLPKTTEEIKFLVEKAKENNIRYLIMGNGTNLLVSDDDLEMIVIKTTELNEVKVVDDLTVEAGCGIMLSRLAVFAMEKALTGLEFAHGIPGTLGGAVSMNAGAYGGEMKDVIKSVTVLENGEIKTYPLSECDLSYRHSRFSDTDAVVLSAVISLTNGVKEEIKAKMDELSAKRRGSQPLNMPSAGSTFKRPVGGYAAALIHESGLKGKGVGGAQVSEKHSGFVVNTGDATFSDVVETMKMIREKVYADSGIELHPEVKIIK